MYFGDNFDHSQWDENHNVNDNQIVGISSNVDDESRGNSEHLLNGSYPLKIPMDDRCNILTYNELSFSSRMEILTSMV
ncbi:unnamed protein product [Heterobilharzia americana]|nr:unnamed protein product [Heterobilharzia americana]